MPFPWPDLVIKPHTTASMSFPVCSSGKDFACNAGDTGLKGSIPASGRSPGGGRGNPLQYSCLEYPMDKGAWWATVHRVAKSQMQLSTCATASMPGKRKCICI